MGIFDWLKGGKKPKPGAERKAGSSGPAPRDIRGLIDRLFNKFSDADRIYCFVPPDEMADLVVKCQAFVKVSWLETNAGFSRDAIRMVLFQPGSDDFVELTGLAKLDDSHTSLSDWCSNFGTDPQTWRVRGKVIDSFLGTVNRVGELTGESLPTSGLVEPSQVPALIVRRRKQLGL